MKNILGTLILVLALTSCSKPVSEQNFIGNWQQVNGSEAAKLSAQINKNGADILVEMTITLQNQPPVKSKQTGQFKDGILQVSGLENVRFVPDSERILIGVNEFERVK